MNEDKPGPTVFEDEADEEVGEDFTFTCACGSQGRSDGEPYLRGEALERGREHLGRVDDPSECDLLVHRMGEDIQEPWASIRGEGDG